MLANSHCCSPVACDNFELFGLIIHDIRLCYSLFARCEFVIAESSVCPCRSGPSYERNAGASDHHERVDLTDLYFKVPGF